MEMKSRQKTLLHSLPVLLASDMCVTHGLLSLRAQKLTSTQNFAGKFILFSGYVCAMWWWRRGGWVEKILYIPVSGHSLWLCRELGCSFRPVPYWHMKTQALSCLYKRPITCHMLFPGRVYHEATYRWRLLSSDQQYLEFLSAGGGGVMSVLMGDSRWSTLRLFKIPSCWSWISPTGNISYWIGWAWTSHVKV